MSELTGARVAFLQGNAINESLGVTDLAGHLVAAGVTTRLFIEREERDLPANLHAFTPDLVVVPTDLLGHNTGLRLARLAQNASSAPVVLGGTHPTFFPNVVERPGVDYAFAGEAEGVVADLVAAVRAGREVDAIPNLIVPTPEGHRVNPLRPLIGDLSAMALPDRELYYRYPFIAGFPWKKFSTGRGCLNSCGYCFNPAYRQMVGGPNGFFRRKTPERICREIAEVHRTHGVGIAHFSDDLFSSGVGWLEGFIEVYQRECGLPFSCNVFATTLNETTVTQLKDAGCRVLAMGLEVADDRLRLEVMNKPATTEQILNAARLVKQAGIRLVTFNILGLPWATPEQDEDTLLLNRELDADHCRVSVLVPFPKSKLTQRLIDDGHLCADFNERIYEVDDLPHWPAESLFARQNVTATMRLFRLWHLLMRLPLPKSWLRRLARSRAAQLLTPLSVLLALYAEKRIFRLPMLPGLRYFWHVKSPALKTTNYVSFV
jgi:radical SAM superfamily enzyme YgiQ (UPF0313 family)